MTCTYALEPYIQNSSHIYSKQYRNSNEAWAIFANKVKRCLQLEYDLGVLIVDNKCANTGLASLFEDLVFFSVLTEKYYYLAPIGYTPMPDKIHVQDLKFSKTRTSKLSRGPITHRYVIWRAPTKARCQYSYREGAIFVLIWLFDRMTANSYMRNNIQ